MHLKRSNVKKFWPVPRKGTKYLAVANHSQGDSIPLVVVMRDMLNIVKNKKELKKLINEKQIQINHKIIKETNYPICLFDIIILPAIKKNYKAMLSKNKKMILEEISEKDSKIKVFKLMSKKILPGKKVQLNLMHGKNIDSNEKVNAGDSIVFDLKENKIIKIIPMEKGRNAFVVKGKHAGYQGNISEIVERGGRKIAKISSENEKINVWVKNIIVIE